jgi:hypothetical protein
VTVPMLMAWYAFVIVVLLVVILTRRKRRKPFIVVDLRPLWTYEQIAETLRPEIRNAIEAAVAVPDPPPIELTRGEKLCIELQAECDHIWDYGEQQILSHGQRLVRSEQLRTCLMCSHSERLLGPLQKVQCDHQMVSVWELGMPLSQCIWCGVDDFTPARSR